MPTCIDCYYFNVEQKLMCRRFPPSQNQWAVVAAADWCGEHQAGVTGAEVAARQAKVAALETKQTWRPVNETNAEPVPVETSANVPKPPAPPPQPQPPPPPPQTKPAATVTATVTPATTFPVRQPAAKETHPDKHLASKPVEHKPKSKHPKPHHR
jgi:hypothetical protein